MPEVILQDLIPLSVAASVAYFDLARMRGSAATEEHLRDGLELAVVALSHVAPIHRLSAPGGTADLLSSTQVEQLLFAPIRRGKQAPDLDAFFIRRSDLHAAIATLRRRL